MISDEELYRQYLSGDETGLEELIRKYDNPLSTVSVFTTAFPLILTHSSSVTKILSSCTCCNTCNGCTASLAAA